MDEKDVIKYDIKHGIRDVITEQKITNPWHMTSISDFLYYCCAECNFKDKIEENFIGHATSEHPKSREIFENNQTFVVQQGDLLNNRYKLLSVDAQFAIFDENGKRYQLSTNLKIDN